MQKKNHQNGYGRGAAVIRGPWSALCAHIWALKHWPEGPGRGLESKIQQHFSLEKKKNSKPKSKFEFFFWGETDKLFFFFFAIFDKIQQIPEIVSLQGLKLNKNS